MEKATRKARKTAYVFATRRPSQTFNYLLKALLWPVFRIFYHYSIDTKGIEGLSPPYLVIANHDMNLDPFLVCSAFRRPAYIVASEHLFRIPILRFILLRLVGGIPKIKGRADTRAVRTMLEGRRLGHPVLLFPETGGRNWGGQTSPIIPATAKLVKLFRTPVVTVVLEGSYLSTPRWAFKARRGRITGRYRVALTAEQATMLPEAEILKALQASIDHDDNLWQQARLAAGQGIVFRGKNLAEGIERALYACPSCEALRSLRSEGDSFRCERCGFGATVDRYGLLDGTPAMRDYSAAVERILERLAAEYLAQSDPTAVFLEEPMRAWSSHRMESMQAIAHGNLRLTRDHLSFDGEDGPVVVPMTEIKGVTCLMSDLLEFIWGEKVYRVVFDDRKASIRLWQTAIRIFADHATGGDSGVVED